MKRRVRHKAICGLAPAYDFFRAARCERASVWLETLTGDPKYQLQNPIDRCNFGKESQKI